MTETKKRDEKEREKALQRAKESPNTLMKAHYEDALARLCLDKGLDGLGATKVKYVPADLLPYLRQEHELWDKFCSIELKPNLKCISMLEKHVRANIKKRNWLQDKMNEQKDRTDLREVKTPETPSIKSDG